MSNFLERFKWELYCIISEYQISRESKYDEYDPYIVADKIINIALQNNKCEIVKFKEFRDLKTNKIFTSDEFENLIYYRYENDLDLPETSLLPTEKELYQYHKAGNKYLFDLYAKYDELIDQL